MFFQKNIKNVQVIFNAMHREVRHYISIHLKRIAILCQDKTQLAPLKKKIRQRRNCFSSILDSSPWAVRDRKSTRLNSSHCGTSRMPSSA